MPYQLTFHGAVKGAQPFVEFPIAGDFQPQPQVIAYTKDSGHPTYVPGDATPYPPTNAKTATGAVSIYDGRAVGKGRVVTGSTFHHYLNKNLIGDPGTQTQPAGTLGGNGPTGSDTGFTGQPALLTSIGAYYINAVTWLAKPSNNFQFWVLKNTFGANESVSAPQGFPDAFYLVVEGYAPNLLGTPPNVAFSGPLWTDGLRFTPGTPILDDPGSPNSAQRVLLPYAVDPIPASAFPTPGGPTKTLALEARLTVGSDVLAAEALFELTASPDPFFANVGAANPPNPGYLSQDLRVFQFAPGAQSAPFISFQTGWTGHDYMTHLLQYLNAPSNNYTNGINNPFDALNLGDDLSEATSVTPTINGSPAMPFALARVRVINTVATTAPAVRVFFRLFTTASNDTDFDPFVTYPSSLDGAGLPDAPQAGLYGTTFPMTASPTVAGDYPGPNQIDIPVPANAETYAWFGCFLDVYGPNSPIPAGGHHCLVAQIAYDQAPIVNSNGLTLSPENSDKLAQRNITFAASGNPGGPAAHRVPQTFDTRPSVRTGDPVQTPAGYPDELAIDWGEVPIGSEVSLYWPQAAAIDVVRLATLLYPSHGLTVADPHTVRFTITSKASYVPIPFAEAPKLAGLLTLDLPQGVRRGQSFAVVVRRISTRSAPVIGRIDAAAVAPGRGPVNTTWRYVVGSFQLTIPVDHEAPLLWSEENALAIFKWRLQQWPTTDRWYPVLQRYVAILAGRVDAFGGDAAHVPPSPTGVPAPHRPGHGHGPGHPPEPGEREFTGKVADVVFDRFGDFEGFVLETSEGARAFASAEPEIGELTLRALRDRLLLSVIAEAHPPHAIRAIIVRATG